MAHRPPAVAEDDLAALSRELKSLIDAAQRLRDRINRHLSVAAQLRLGGSSVLRTRLPAGARKANRAGNRH